MKTIKFNFKSNNKLRVNVTVTQKSFFYSKKKLSISATFSKQIYITSLNKVLQTSTDNLFDWWILLTIPAQEANLLPPLGPILGQHGFNTVNFCSNFNEISKEIAKGVPCKVLIKLFLNKTFYFKIQSPITSFMLYSACTLNKSNWLMFLDLLKIGIIKKIDILSLPLISVCHSIAGSAKSMNLKF